MYVSPCFLTYPRLFLAAYLASFPGLLSPLRAWERGYAHSTMIAKFVLAGLPQCNT